MNNYEINSRTEIYLFILMTMTVFYFVHFFDLMFVWRFRDILAFLWYLFYISLINQKSEFRIKLQNCKKQNKQKTNSTVR